jgi:hypothetical protein
MTALSWTCTSHKTLRPVAEGITTSVARIQTDTGHRKAVAARSLERHVVVNDDAQSSDEFDLAVIELDDQGWQWNPRQLRLALEVTDRAAQDSGALIVMFFHGWKNNAAVCNVNLACFREALARLARFERSVAKAFQVPPRRVIGIYPAWRGLSLKFPKNFSFWGRKETAHRVGRASAVEVVAEFDALRRRLTAENRTRLVFIGHSFGAAVLYEASAGVVRHGLVSAMNRWAGTTCLPEQPEIDRVDGLGDLMVLVNPAFEASLYHDVDVRTHWFQSYSRLQTPALVTVSSKGDWATRTFFPIGRSVSTIAQQTRGKDQRDTLRETIGNYEPFITHRLKRSRMDSPSAAAHGRPTCSCPEQLPELELDDVMLPEQDACELHLGATRQYGSVVLEKRPDVSADNPFSVVEADEDVISDHTGIFTAPFFEFLVRYVAAIDQKKRLIHGRPSP